MSANAVKSPGLNGPMPESAPESLDQVRDILFGGQMRMVDARLQGLEARLQQEQASLRAEFSREIAEVDETMKKGIAQLNDGLASERSKRTDDLKALTADMRELVRASSDGISRSKRPRHKRTLNCATTSSGRARRNPPI